MGFFSWKTSDTNKSIANVYSRRRTFHVHVITHDRKIFTEKEYNGYGVFGGKDIYTLIGEMNGIKGKTSDNIRSKTFDKLLAGGIRKGKKKYIYRVDFVNYESPIKAEGGKTANQLREKGFEDIFPRFDFSDFVKEGIICPKIVQKLPKKYNLMSDKEWEAYFDSLPYPKNCEAQGCY